MKTGKQLGSGQEIIEMFDFNRRWITFVLFSAALSSLRSPATLCLVFGVLNIVGSLKVKDTTISFRESECPGNVCSKSLSLDYTGKSYIYVDYDFLLTSYFIYAKGTSYNDVFKRSSFRTNTDDCFPVATFNDYKRVFDLLNLQVTNPKVLAGLLVNGGNNKISPCGLKAALFDHIGSLTVTQTASGEVFSLNQRDIINERYYKLIGSDQSDFVDVTSGRFFSWYMPQMPAFGTKIFHGIAEKDLRGAFTFTFDQSTPNSRSECLLRQATAAEHPHRAAGARRLAALFEPDLRRLHARSGRHRGRHGIDLPVPQEETRRLAHQCRPHACRKHQSEVVLTLSLYLEYEF